MDYILKGKLTLQFSPSCTEEVLAGMASGMGVPRVIHSQQSLASVGLEIFRALCVASKMLEVWVLRSTPRDFGRANG